MRARALIWTNADGVTHAIVNTLSPGQIESDLRFWAQAFPETRPEIRDVEITWVDRERDTDPAPSGALTPGRHGYEPEPEEV